MKPTPVLHTMWAIGKYENVTHSGRKTTQEDSFTRSATAPLISAAVMTAKVSWKQTASYEPQSTSFWALRVKGSENTPPALLFGPNDSDQPQRT